MGTFNDTVQFKAGLRMFGDKGAKAAMDKLTQLHIMDTWTAIDPSKIT
jgi:hypothetical protein